MQINELMIGDLIYYDDEIIVVDSLYKHNNYYRINDDRYTLSFAGPIPLTTEFLAARFKKVTEYKEELFAVNDRFGVKQYPPKWNRGDGWYFTLRHVDVPIAKVSHIHELQHILRFCGLSELTDNFKV